MRSWNVFRGLRLYGEAADFGGAKSSWVNNVPVQIEDGGVIEGFCDFVQFEVGPDAFLVFIEDAVGQKVGVLVQDAPTESVHVVAVMPVERIKFTVFGLVGFGEVLVEVAERVFDNGGAAQGGVGAQAHSGVADEFQEEHVV